MTHSGAALEIQGAGPPNVLGVLMPFQTFVSTGSSVISLPTNFGLVAVPSFVRTVERDAESGAPLVIDGSRVVQVDIAGVRALLWACRWLTSRRCQVSVVLPSPGVLSDPLRRIVADSVPVYDDLSHALSAG
jgi:anti-anti-sigma regulatory factor